jgi:curved DNA-binding protein CbpA
MTLDLHAALGIDRSADTAAVHRAYRQQAKKAHPDAPGGSAERFALIKLAHDTLSDEITRALYEQTGEIRDREPDNRHGEALQCIAAAFEAALAECESRGLKFTHYDLADRMRAWTAGQVKSFQANIDVLNQRIADLDAIGARFTGEVMPAILRGRRSILDAGVAAARRNQQSAEMALEILKPVSYRADMASQPPSLAQLLGHVR